jgi:protein tyrosine phosphatase (PTP) superfamily phosphohydrolase (DUF442 family)
MEKAHREIYNYLRLSSRITTSGMPQKDEIDLIAGLGVDSVISLVPENVGSDWPGEKDRVTAAGMTFSRIPVIFKSPEIADFKLFQQWMANHATQKIHVHCEVNMRVSVFMALHRMVMENWPESRAMAPIGEIWQPNEIWQDFIKKVLTHFGIGHS